MKTPFKISLLIWTCNILMVLMAVFLIAGTVYYFKIPGLISNINHPVDSELITKSSYRLSQNFLSDDFTYVRNRNTEEGVDEEMFYFASKKNLYKISFNDSPDISANKVNRELSSQDSKFAGFKTTSVVVTEPAGTTPVRFAAPAIPLERGEFLEYARANVLFLLSALLFGIIFLWFLRKFITGLRNPVFFTHQNAVCLKITAYLFVAAPIFAWAWNKWIRPDLFTEYQFTQAVEVSSATGLPAMALFFGLLLLVIAWCFEQGVNLQKEQELTI